MNYATLRFSATTGDLILYAGTSLLSRLVRVSTGSQYSHVGLLLWKEDTLWFSEMKIGAGYTLSPASTHLKELTQTGVVRYSPAPAGMDSKVAEKAILKYRDGGTREKDPNYSLTGAVIVWMAQWIPSFVPSFIKAPFESFTRRRFVCSTYVQSIWEAAGVSFDKPADPEDLARMVETLTMLEFPKELTEK